MMRELADNIMDIAQNSISAGAILTEVHVKISHADNMITFVFKDDGCGMSEELVKSVIEPFTTTRKTRKVGLGLPLLKQTAEMEFWAISMILSDSSRIMAFYPISCGTFRSRRQPGRGSDGRTRHH